MKSFCTLHQKFSRDFTSVLMRRKIKKFFCDFWGIKFFSQNLVILHKSFALQKMAFVSTK